MPPLARPLTRLPLFALCSLLGLGSFSAAARAGSVTAESIWSQQNAEERARSQIPAGSVIQNRSCETFEVRNDLRYRCTLDFGPAPAADALPNTTP
ncbi:MAG: hypothetical protein ACOYLI_03790 [Synechococcus lacustris]|jgi:hypothetical protein